MDHSASLRPSGRRRQPRRNPAASPFRPPRDFAAPGPADLTDLDSAYSLWAGRCLGVALAVTSDPGLAEDAVQEAFCAWWRQRDRRSVTAASVGLVLLTLTHRRAVQALRSDSQREPTVAEPALEQVPAGVLRPAVSGDSNQHRSKVQMAMSALPQMQQQVLMLAYFGGYTQTRIAGLLDIPLETVRAYCSTALRQLRIELDRADHGNSLAG